MMILDDIDVYLNPDDFLHERHYCVDFNWRQRYIGNFLRRWIKPTKYRTESFRRLYMQGRLVAFDDPCRVQGEACLIVPFRFDKARYDSLGPEGDHEFFLGMYIEGIEKANRDFPIPYDVLMKGIEDFRRGGYKNEWVHKRKLLRPLGLHATLLCDMDTNRFELTLLLERKGVTVFRKPIYVTQPDEIMFKGDFKDVIVENNQIIVKEEYGKNTFTLDVDSLQ